MTPPDEALDRLCLGNWEAHHASGELRLPGRIERLEPRVMDLLFLLGERPGEVFTREEILARLWPEVVVTEDALARTVFKLRKALGDDAKAPRYIETLPKRGYRLIPAPRIPALDTIPPKKERPRPWRLLTGGAAAVLTALMLASSPPRARSEAAALTDRANDFYFQYTRADNEAAIELFQRVITLHPDHAPAYAGLGNALAQRVIRWPGAFNPDHRPSDTSGTFSRLGDALRGGYPRSSEGRRELAQAETMARRAVTLAPQDPISHKALGFVRSAQEDFSGALVSYRRAVELDPDAWGPLINIGDLLELSGQPEAALPSFEAAFAAMTRAYDREPVRIRPWYAATASLVADRHRALGHLPEAERWYRKALDLSPLHPEASAHLADLLASTHREAEAATLRQRLQEKLGQR